MSTSPLLVKLRTAFADCHEVESDTYRCVLKYRGKPRGIYFFRSVWRLPDQAELAQLNERVISPSYFSAHDAVRWNLYLVLVAESAVDLKDFYERKRVIEGDRRYARKVVLQRAELDSFLERRTPQPSQEALGQSILDVWRTRLEAAGLGDIAADVPRAKVIRSIRSGELIKGVSMSTSTMDVPSTFGMEKLEVEQFGNRKLVGTFSFGRVTLLRGPNGSGKTSLLECIEHFYCGATNRSKGKVEMLNAVAFPANGGEPIRYKQLSNDEYQARDRVWYGRLTNKGNRLWEGFARYNFLDTDAAVNFTNDNDRRDIEDALSKVALGPSVSFIWNRLEEFVRDLERDIAPLRKSIKELEVEKAHALERLNALRAVSPQVRATVEIVRDDLQALGWPFTLNVDGSPDLEWFKSLAPLQDFVTAHARAGAPATLAEVEEKREQIASDLVLTSRIGIEITACATERAKSARKQTECEVQIRKMHRLREYARTSFPDTYDMLKKCEHERSRCAPLVVTETELEELARATDMIGGRSLSAAECESRLRSELKSAREQMEALKRRRQVLLRGAEALQSLESQIRALGLQYAKEAHDVHSCPLCGTAMEMDQLLDGINRLGGVDAFRPEMEVMANAESHANTRISELSGALRTLERLVAASDPPATMEELLRNSRDLRSHVDQLRRIVDQAQSLLDSLAQTGFVAAEYEELLAQLPGGGARANAGASSLSDLDVQIASLEAEIALLQETVQRSEQREADLFKQLLALIQKYGLTSTSADDLRDTLQRELAASQRLIKSHGSLPVAVRSVAVSFEQFRSRCDELLKKVESLNLQLQQERSRDEEIRLLQDRIANLDLEHELDKLECMRMEEAYETLRDLKDSHSLSSALEAFFASNLEAIQHIFSKIHIPRELNVGDLANCSLERLGTRQPASLAEISTGQRAAFVLSVFLTLNLSLRNGPPLMMIDDPIAHIDDLNGLLFLDFLADVAESGNRQILFATANEKLANLFEKKMAFLGDEFRVLPLPRLHVH